MLLPGSEVILDDAARERAQNAVYEDVRKELLTPSAGNVWLDKFQEGHQFGAFESVLPVFYEKTVTLLDYLDPSTIIVWSDAVQVRGEMEGIYWKACRDWENHHSPHEWKRPPNELFEAPRGTRQGSGAISTGVGEPSIHARRVGDRLRRGCGGP